MTKQSYASPQAVKQALSKEQYIANDEIATTVYLAQQFPIQGPRVLPGGPGQNHFWQRYRIFFRVVL